MFSAEKIGTTVVIVIGIFLISLWLLFEFRPFFDQFNPAYREAKATCDSIRPGMTVEELKAKFGNLFLPGPATYIDNKGNGQVWLVNNVTSTQVSCNIQIAGGRVTSAGMADEGAF